MPSRVRDSTYQIVGPISKDFHLILRSRRPSRPTPTGSCCPRRRRFSLPRHQKTLRVDGFFLFEYTPQVVSGCTNMGKAWRTLCITWCAWEVWVVSGALELSPRGFLATNGCGNCHACTPTPVESPTEDRRRAAKRIATACATNNCTEDELAIVLAIAMQESDSMDKTDTSKTGLAKNVSPFNLNLAELALLGCDAQCANGLGQNSRTYNLQEATYWLLKGVRGTGAVGSTDDFLNYHRGGSTGWRACKGKGSGCDCVPRQ